MYTELTYEVDEGVATVTLNRPEAMNSLTSNLEREMHEALDQADADPKVRCIILTGAGKAFCAGYDMGAEGPDGRPMDPTNKSVGDYIAHWYHGDRKATANLMHLWNLNKPVIAAVNGWALGGGFWYQLACDITIAAESAVFGQPEVRHISNSTFLLAALVGWKHANRYALTGDHIDSAEALRIGIVNEVVKDEELMDTARALALRIGKVPEAAVRANKAISMMGLQAAGVQSGMIVNAGLSAIVHSSHGPDRERLFQAQREGGLRGYLSARDDPFRPEPFGPRSGK
jgi:enoyl-CoA hydratase/carnithine racemase